MYSEVEKLCKLLADRTRLEIIHELLYREVCICDFVEYFNLSQPAISKHIKKLRDSGMLLERREAQWKHYKMNIEYKHYDLVKCIVEQCNQQMFSENKTK